jgi:hypothetical protein
MSLRGIKPATVDGRPHRTRRERGCAAVKRAPNALTRSPPRLQRESLAGERGRLRLNGELSAIPMIARNEQRELGQQPLDVTSADTGLRCALRRRPGSDHDRRRGRADEPTPWNILRRGTSATRDGPAKLSRNSHWGTLCRPGMLCMPPWSAVSSRSLSPRSWRSTLQRHPRCGPRLSGFWSPRRRVPPPSTRPWGSVLGVERRARNPSYGECACPTGRGRSRAGLPGRRRGAGRTTWSAPGTPGRATCRAESSHTRRAAGSRGSTRGR